MAITKIGGDTARAGAGDGANATISLTNLTGLAKDDLVVIVHGLSEDDLQPDKTMALVGASGWTKQADLYAANAAQLNSNLAVWTKVMGATPDTSVELDGNGHWSGSTAGLAFAYRGVDTTTPMDVTATTNTVTNSADITPASINFSDSGAAVVICTAHGHNRGSTVNLVFPTNYTADGAVWYAGDDPSDCTVGQSPYFSPSDPESPGEVAINASDSTQYASCSVTLALRPAAGGIIPQAMHHRTTASY
jgi:hypothetical protein